MLNKIFYISQLITSKANSATVFNGCPPQQQQQPRLIFLVDADFFKINIFFQIEGSREGMGLAFPTQKLALKKR